MVLKDDLDEYYKAIEKNLENTDAMDLYATVWHDDAPCIYYPSEGKNGEVYYVLYPNFDIDRAKSKYIGCLSTQVLVATQEKNALNCLGLQLKDGNICNFFLTDISLTYKFSDRFSMDFQLVNLFNEREYSYTSFSNEAMRINKRYMIRPGNLLIGACVTF